MSAPDPHGGGAATRYRPDIDGLRALAVVPVVLYHAHLWPFAGGYVGVDIFFVISGYLITALLESDLARGQFSIVRFYERRIRRIFPALFFVLAFCFCVTALLYMPLDFKQFGYSAVSLAVFGSNIVFWRTAGYFDTEAELKPLLHTWSLSVEEQFYVVFPWVLWLIYRFAGRGRSAVIIGLAVLSFVCAVVQVETAPVAAFYLPFSRAWELLLGALLADQRWRPPASPILREATGLLGLAMIAYAIVCYGTRTPFPGLAAVPPCVGAALIVYSGQGRGTLTARVLENRALVGLGLISYSLYLWHWPLLAFARYFLTHEPSLPEIWGLIAASTALAAFSWRFVERPFRRRGTGGVSTRAIFGAAFAGTGLILAAGLMIYAAAGLPQRLSPEAQRLAAGATDTMVGLSACDRLIGADVLAGRACTIGDPGAAPSFALLGDSFGVALKPGIEEAAKAARRRGVSLVRGACYPVPTAREFYNPDPACETFNNDVFEFLAKQPELSTVIIVARWTSFAEGNSFKERDMFMVDASSRTAGYAENKRVFDRSLRAALDRLNGKNVYVVVGVPEQPVDVPRAAALSAYLGRAIQVDSTKAAYDRREQFVKQEFGQLASAYPIHVLDAGSMLCGASVCPALSDGIPLYSDSDHLSQFGARSIAGLFAPAFDSR